MPFATEHPWSLTSDVSWFTHSSSDGPASGLGNCDFEPLSDCMQLWLYLHTSQHLLPEESHPQEYRRNAFAESYHWQRAISGFQAELNSQKGMGAHNMDALLSTSMLLAILSFSLDDFDPKKSFVYSDNPRRPELVHDPDWTEGTSHRAPTPHKPIDLDAGFQGYR